MCIIKLELVGYLRYFRSDIKFSLNLLVCIFLSYYRSSYGSVFKAMHKESGQVVAIKQVPVDTDLQEIIKEISMMQQCDRYIRY